MIFTLQFGDYEFPNQTFEVGGYPIDQTISEDSVVRRDGAIIQTPYLQPRKFKISGMIHNNNRDTSKTQLDSMQTALLAGEYAFKSRSDREIKAYVRKFKSNPEPGTDNGVIRVTIDMIAQNPFFTNAGLSLSDTVSLGSGGVNFDISVGGNAFTEPRIYALPSATITDDFTLTNTTNDNQQMRYRGTMAPGITIEFDSENLELLVNSVDGISLFEGEFINLLAGTNTFNYTGSPVQLTIDRKNRWY